MALLTSDVVGQIVAAVRPHVAKHWKDAKRYAELEAAKLAQTLELVVELKLAGKIDEQQARALIEMQKHSMQAVLLALEGIGLVAAQNAVNAALKVVKDLVNGAIKFPLL